jgi:hypothetical protein
MGARRGGARGRGGAGARVGNTRRILAVDAWRRLVIEVGVAGLAVGIAGSAEPAPRFGPVSTRARHAVRSTVAA